MVNSENCSSTNYNKPAYFGMLILGIILALFLGDYSMGASMIALSIIFYPFDPKTKWPDKSVLQKTLVLGHLVIAIALIAYSLFIIVQ